MVMQDFSDELIDQLLAGYQEAGELTGPDGLINQLRKRLIERAAGAELSSISATRRVRSRPRRSPTGATARRVRRCGRSMGRSRSSCRATATRLRAADRAQARSQLRWLRRADPGALCGRDDDARYPAPPARALQRRGLGGADQRGHRVDPGRRAGLAEPAARGALRRRLPGRDEVSIRDQQVVRKKAVTSRSASRSTASATASASGSKRPRARASGRAS